jgi:hypothetical protein
MASTTFRSTVTPPTPETIRSTTRLLVNPNTGAPMGIENQSANGADAMITPIDITAAQLASPTAAMIADLDSTFRLNVAPYTRYQSNGTTLVGLAEAPDEFIGIAASLSTVPVGNPGLTVGPNSQAVIYGAFTVKNAGGVTVQGTLRVYNWP